MLQIGTEATIDRSEECLASLADRPRTQLRELKLASNLRNQHCGGLASLVQAVVTWARIIGPEAVLVTHAPGTGPRPALASLAETLPGLAAILMANDIRAADAATSLRAEAYALARSQVDPMDAGDFAATYRGVAVAMLCADETSKRALKPFYHPTSDGEGELRGEKEFVELTRRILNSAVSEPRRGDFDDRDVEALGVMLRELFGNTHHHAKRDPSGNTPYRKSVRGVFATHHLVAAGNIPAVAGTYEPLGQYLRDVADRTPVGTHSQLFELSIFDSGPGYAARRLGRSFEADVSLSAEFKAVTQCFMKNVSTLRPTGGIGLVRTLSRLKDRGGFLRLRTGRLSLYKMFEQPAPGRARDRGADVAGLAAQDFELNDAKSLSRSLTAQPWSAGALVTVLVPLGRHR